MNKIRLFMQILLLFFLVFFLSNSVLAKCIKGNCINGIGTFSKEEEHGIREYSGPWKNGNKHGYGIETFYQTKLKRVLYKYEGLWFDDNKNGKILWTMYGDGNYQKCDIKIRGDFKDDYPVYGSFTLCNGDQYRGEFDDGWAKGQGTYIEKSSGLKIIGVFEDNFYRIKEGTIIFQKGKEYKVTSKKSNIKKINIEPGSYYEGEIIGNLMHGHGILTLSNGMKFTGEFDKNIPVDMSKFVQFFENVSNKNKKENNQQKKKEEISLNNKYPNFIINLQSFVSTINTGILIKANCYEVQIILQNLFKYIDTKDNRILYAKYIREKVIKGGTFDFWKLETYINQIKNLAIGNNHKLCRGYFYQTLNNVLYSDNL